MWTKQNFGTLFEIQKKNPKLQDIIYKFKVFFL